MAKKEKRGNMGNHQSALHNKPREVTKNPVAWTEYDKRRNLYVGMRHLSTKQQEGYLELGLRNDELTECVQI